MEIELELTASGICNFNITSGDKTQNIFGSSKHSTGIINFYSKI